MLGAGGGLVGLGYGLRNVVGEPDQSKVVALTFDDGPGPYTDRLLGILNDHNARATFFLIGNKVAANPDGAKRIAEAGMEVGKHTWEHPNMTIIPPRTSPASYPRPTTPSPWRPGTPRSCTALPVGCPTTRCTPPPPSSD
jgi:peptidoglycan/xylan/chitin deacetylase (PgdA/CDA1 family)